MPWSWVLWMWVPLINVVAGLWLIAAPYAMGTTNATEVWTSIAVGIVALIVGLLTWYGHYAVRSLTWLWLNWINVALGLWTIAMPFVLGFTTGTAINMAVSGAVIVVVAFVHWLVNFIGRSAVMEARAR